MKRNQLFTLLMLCCCSVFATSKETDQTNVKIGYIDKEALLFQMPEIVQVNDSIMKAQNEYKEIYRQYELELAQKSEYLAKHKESMSSNLLMLKAKEIDDIKQYMQYLQQIAQEDMNSLQIKLLEPIEKRIDAAIEAVGAENNFTFITKVRWDRYLPALPA